MNSPGVFQRYVNAIFRDLTRSGIAIPYVDDIIVPPADEGEAVANLKTVVRRCEEYGLVINLKKYCFLKKKIKFLGHCIENQSISISDDKTKAVTKFPPPTNRKQLQSFLGLVGYFRKCILSFSIIDKPLTDLMKHGAKFCFSVREIDAFNKLKSLITQKPVLKIFHPQHETELHTTPKIS